MSNRLQLALTHALEAMARLESNLVDKLGSGDHIEVVKAEIANATAELNAAAAPVAPVETAPETAGQPAAQEPPADPAPAAEAQFPVDPAPAS